MCEDLDIVCKVLQVSHLSFWQKLFAYNILLILLVRKYVMIYQSTLHDL